MNLILFTSFFIQCVYGYKTSVPRLWMQMSPGKPNQCGCGKSAPIIKNSPNFFNHWTCVGLKNSIDFSEPYKINIGELPLVIWKNQNTGKLISVINICKHMGSKLDNGIITKSGCLKCKYHGLEMTEADAFGETVEHEGKIFWAYKPLQKQPHKIPYFHNKNYETSFIELDMDASLTDCAYNTMDLRHPEFVHNFGFGNSVPPRNIKEFQYRSPVTGKYDRLGLSFEYLSNRIMQKMNANTQSTQNFHMFIHPTFTWSRVSFEDKHLIVAVNFLPLENKKTRWFVTLCHNYYMTGLQQRFMKMMALTILTQDYLQMKNQYTESPMKKLLLFNYRFPDEGAVLKLHDMFQEYKYPDMDYCVDFVRNSAINKTLPK